MNETIVERGSWTQLKQKTVELKLLEQKVQPDLEQLLILNTPMLKRITNLEEFKGN